MALTGSAEVERIFDRFIPSSDRDSRNCANAMLLQQPRARGWRHVAERWLQKIGERGDTPHRTARAHHPDRTAPPTRQALSPLLTRTQDKTRHNTQKNRTEANHTCCSILVAMSTNLEHIGGRCDICNRGDGKSREEQATRRNMQECRDCGIKVHETCYGMPNTNAKDPDFRCHACKAVGRTILVSKPHQEVKTMAQRKRPVACALCPIKTGPHAMHPLYDVNGTEGRQVVNKNNELAWVHTLCAMYISSYNGYVYGCDRDGKAYDADADTTEDTSKAPDGMSSTAEGREITAVSTAEGGENTAAISAAEDGEITAVSTAYFVIGGKETGKDADWAKETRSNILNARRGVCFICNKKDNIHGVLRIPVECSAGSKNEPQQLIDDRKNADEICTKPMHVGCARWGLTSRGEPARYRRVFYYPGLPAQTNESTTNALKSGLLDNKVACYCNKHAKQLKEGQDIRKRYERKRRMVIEEEDEDGEEENGGDREEDNNESSNDNANDVESNTGGSVAVSL